MQEAETGQVALNLRRHRGIVNLGRKLFEDERFVKQIVYGDKDIFRFMFLLSGEPFFFVPERVGFAVVDRYALDSVVHSFNTYTSEGSQGVKLLRDAAGEFADSLPIFFHQVKLRNPKSFSHYLRFAPPDRRTVPPSVCFDGSERQRSEVESPPGAEELERFADRLFRDVDAKWASSQADDYLYYYDMKDYAVSRWNSLKHAGEDIGLAWIAFIIILLATLLAFMRRRKCFK